MSQQFTPELVFNLIANNPQGRAFVENLAKMNQLQQAAQQFAPQIQQFAQSPMQAMQNIGDWAQGAVNQMAQQQSSANGQQPPTNAQQPNPEQQGGPPVNNIMGMAMEIVGKFENNFKEMGEALKTINDSNAALTEQVTALTDSNKALSVDLAVSKSTLEALRKDLGKLTTAKG